MPASAESAPDTNLDTTPRPPEVPEGEVSCERFEVAEKEHRERLDAILAGRLPALSRMLIRTLLDRGEVRVDGEPRPAGYRPAAGSTVAAAVPVGSTSAMSPEPMPLVILHQDEHLLVVDKPVGLVVHPAGRHRSGTLVNGLCHLLNVEQKREPPVRPGVVHRLDRATSGLMVVALTQPALSRLTVQFQRREVRKRYLALVHGSPAEEEGTWEASIGARESGSPRWGVVPEGRPAVTRFRRLAAEEQQTLLELEPVTGRTNQLRIHCSHFGFPILGDDLFGVEDGHDRLHLHAYLLEFRHPATGDWLAFRRAPEGWTQRGRSLATWTSSSSMSPSPLTSRSP